MPWIIAAVVVVVLGALAWWSSGRAKPSERRQGEPAGGVGTVSRADSHTISSHAHQTRNTFGPS